MRTILITYDLRQAGQNYDGLLNKIRSYSSWCRFLASAWLIKTDLNCVQVRDELARLIDSNDGLVVLDVSNDAAAWRGLSAEVDDWILSNL